MTLITICSVDPSGFYSELIYGLWQNNPAWKPHLTQFKREASFMVVLTTYHNVNLNYKTVHHTKAG